MFYHSIILWTQQPPLLNSSQSKWTLIYSVLDSFAKLQVSLLAGSDYVAVSCPHVIAVEITVIELCHHCPIKDTHTRGIVSQFQDSG